MVRSTVALVAALAVASSIVAMPGEASAFCRTTTNGDFEPTDEMPCDLEGTPIFWDTRCVDMFVNRRPSLQVDAETARALVGQAFQTWAAVSCPSDPLACSGPDVGAPSIAIREAGFTDCGAGFQRDGANANVVIFHDAGFPGADDSTLALTTVTYLTSTGRILDADLEVNADPSLFTFSTGDPGPDEFDLLSVLVHEVGHVLGLAHTQPQNVDATMVVSYSPGETSLRTLAPDDVCGVCAAYPPDRDVACAPGDPGACGVVGSTDAGPGDSGLADAGPIGDASVVEDVGGVPTDAGPIDGDAGPVPGVQPPPGEPQPYDSCTCTAGPGARTSGLGAFALAAAVLAAITRSSARRTSSAGRRARR